MRSCKLERCEPTSPTWQQSRIRSSPPRREQETEEASPAPCVPQARSPDRPRMGKNKTSRPAKEKKGQAEKEGGAALREPSGRPVLLQAWFEDEWSRRHRPI
eukprot:1982869-Prymnesium_polylepis.1